MQTERTLAAFVVAAAAVGGCGIEAQAQDGAGYTEDQARAGQLAYESVCASCHMANLQGDFEAPELAGPNFLNRWGGREVNELFLHMQASMPPAGRKPSDESFTDIIAYLLERNGLEAGGARLVATATTLIPTRDVVAGRAPVAAPAPAARRADAPTQPGGPGAPSPPLPSLQWNDVVEDYRPVTAEMLLDPPPGDWLMFRRTYDGQGHSPLDQITTENVGDLQLAWVWSMADGSNQPTPLVHDGIMYLTNPGNIIQALDARTGDVIWQYAREFPEGLNRGGSRLRNISIYLDKLFIATGTLRWSRSTRGVRDRLGASDRGPRAGLHQLERADGDGRGRGQRHQRLLAVPGRQLLHHGARSRHRRGALADVHHRPTGGAGRGLVG